MLLALALALPLHAATVMLAPATIGSRLQVKLHDLYGAGEATELKSAVAEYLGREFKAAGVTVDAAAPLRIEVSIEDAVPTHPTRYQLQQTPSLDYLRSISRGGAHLVAVLRAADGKEIDRVDLDYSPASLDEVSPAGGAWGDARVAMDRFSVQVLKAWRRRAH